MENHGDFIIAWDDSSTHFTIGGQELSSQLTIGRRQINFSQLERDNEDFATVMGWARLVIDLALFGILGNQVYLVILQALGVATYEYGHKQEEKAKAQQQARNQVFNANQERLREYNRMARAKGWTK